MNALPLAGLRVLDLSRLLPGGFCSLLLADFGADVIKVEDTGPGDYVRWSPPHYEGADQSASATGTYHFSEHVSVDGGITYRQGRTHGSVAQAVDFQDTIGSLGVVLSY